MGIGIDKKRWKICCDGWSRGGSTDAFLLGIGFLQKICEWNRLQSVASEKTYIHMKMEFKNEINDCSGDCPLFDCLHLPLVHPNLDIHYPNANFSNGRRSNYFSKELIDRPSLKTMELVSTSSDRFPSFQREFSSNKERFMKGRLIDSRSRSLDSVGDLENQ